MITFFDIRALVFDPRAYISVAVSRMFRGVMIDQSGFKRVFQHGVTNHTD